MASAYRLTAMIVMFPAVMPAMFDVVAMVIAIIIAFMRLGHDASRCHGDQAQQESAFDNSLDIGHQLAPWDDIGRVTWTAAK
jgi:hypothetical protein